MGETPLFPLEKKFGPITSCRNVEQINTHFFKNAVLLQVCTSMIIFVVQLPFPNLIVHYWSTLYIMKKRSLNGFSCRNFKNMSAFLSHKFSSSTGNEGVGPIWFQKKMPKSEKESFFLNFDSFQVIFLSFHINPDRSNVPVEMKGCKWLFNAQYFFIFFLYIWFIL